MDQDKINYYWKSFVGLLDFVDLIKEQPTLKAKLKTKILDLAHEVREELKDCNEECTSIVEQNENKIIAKVQKKFKK